MTREEITICKMYLDDLSKYHNCNEYKLLMQLLEQQEPCEMTAEEYRQRMMQAFLDTDCEELIALCVLPTEKDFEHLKWLLKNHYKKEEPCEEWLRENYYKQEPSEDAANRQAAIKLLVNATYSDEWQGNEDLQTALNMAIDAIKILEDFERAQIITGGRLNGRTFAYKCGLEDGKRKALEQQEPCENCISRTNALRVAKNEYLRGWHDALCKALSEKYSIHCEEGNFTVIQEETITGLGLSMDCAVGKDVENYMSTLPSVIPTTRWIPCSERLPKDRDWYLGIFKEPDTGWINPVPFICDYVGRETRATTKEHWILKGFTDRDEHIDYYFNLECVEWQPLPESYKEESEK